MDVCKKPYKEDFICDFMLVALSRLELCSSGPYAASSGKKNYHYSLLNVAEVYSSRRQYL